MFEKVTKEMIERCVKELEFYDEHGHFSYEKKKISVSLSYGVLAKLKGKPSQEIERALINSQK